MSNVAPDGGGMLSSLTDLMDEKQQRLRKWLVMYGMTNLVFRMAYQVFIKIRNQVSYQVSVFSDDPIYPLLHRRLLELMPPQKRKAITIKTLRRHNEWTGKTESEMHSLYDGSREQVITISGHRVKVWIQKGEVEAKLDSMMVDGGLLSSLSKDRIFFSTHSQEARSAVLEYLTEVSAACYTDDRVPRLMIATTWGSWKVHSALNLRGLDTVVLKAGQIESLVADLETFLSAERDYGTLGIPWHRCYMLTGPAGTGKTSLAKALATHLNMDLYYVPLADMTKDSDLISMFSQVESGSVLLLEDIDIFHATRERDDEAGGVSLSGLLNVLDGVSTPNGLITILTTNKPEVLDDALIRPGRVDRIEEIGLCEPEHFQRLVKVLTGQTVDFNPPEPIAPANIVEVIKPHLGDPENAILALKEFCNEHSNN